MIKDIHKENLIYKNKLSSLRSIMIDSWYTIPYYGKVDTFGHLIIPKVNRMTYCSNIFGDDQSNVLCFDFVADSVLSFQDDLKKRIIQNSFKIPLSNGIFKILSGFIDSLDHYCKELGSVINLQHQKVDTYERFLEKAELFDYRSTGLEIQISGFPEILSILENYPEQAFILDELMAKYGLTFRNSTKFLTYDLYSSHFKSKVRNNALFFSSENDEFKLYLQDFFDQYYMKASTVSQQVFFSFFSLLTNKDYVLKRKEEKEDPSSYGFLNPSIFPNYYPSLK